MYTCVYTRGGIESKYLIPYILKGKEVTKVKEGFNMKKAVIVSLVALGFIVLATYCVSVTGSRDALRDTLASTQDTLTATQAELVSVHGELASTDAELASTQTDLNSARGVLASTEAELTSVQGTLATTQDTLTATEGTLATTKAELLSTQSGLTSTQNTLAIAQQQLAGVTQELDVAQETLAGLGITISSSDQNYDADLVDNPEAVNPSWDELVSFLASDQTENNEYISDVYDCSEFSRDVHNNAEAAGIRSAVVHTDFVNALFGHALNAFLTTDYGLVYIDCTGPPDTVARVEEGEECRLVEVGAFSPSNVRDDSWWDGLTSSDYFIFVAYWAGYSPVAAVTSDITIFW